MKIGDQAFSLRLWCRRGGTWGGRGVGQGVEGLSGASGLSMEFPRPEYWSGERNDLALSGQRAGPMEVLGRKHWEQGILCLQSQHSSDRGGGL